MRIFLLICKRKKKKKTVAQHRASSPRVATRGANLGFQPRDVELGPKALPLPTSLAPGVHSEVRVHLLRTFDSHRFSRAGTKFFKVKELSLSFKRQLINHPLQTLYFTTMVISSAAQSCPTVCDPMNHSTPGLSRGPQRRDFPRTMQIVAGRGLSQ